jgi:RNA 2',3'-cyclic 3'-phosphodiesterase
VTRAFVAVRLPEPVLDAIAGCLDDLTLPGRATTREQWHLTLQFLGDDADLEAVAGALDGLEVAGGRARISGAGAFPDERRARVLWLGLAEGTAVVTRLAGAVATRLAPLGHAPDPRPFRPHLTLARYRAPTDVHDLVGALGREQVGPAWDLDAVTVYESRRRPDGADYVARATIPLGTALPT